MGHSESSLHLLSLGRIKSPGFQATETGTRHLIMATFKLSLTPRQATIAYPKIANDCHQGRATRSGIPTRVRVVPIKASAIMADRRVLLGKVRQNQLRSRADITGDKAK